MNSMKKQKDMTLEESPSAQVSNMLLAKGGEIAPERMKILDQSGNNAQLWMCLMAKVKSSAAKNSIS